MGWRGGVGFAAAPSRLGFIRLRFCGRQRRSQRPGPHFVVWESRGPFDQAETDELYISSAHWQVRDFEARGARALTFEALPGEHHPRAQGFRPLPARKGAFRRIAPGPDACERNPAAGRRRTIRGRRFFFPLFFGSGGWWRRLRKLDLAAAPGHRSAKRNPGSVRTDGGLADLPRCGNARRRKCGRREERGQRRCYFDPLPHAPPPKRERFRELNELTSCPRLHRAAGAAGACRPAPSARGCPVARRG